MKGSKSRGVQRRKWLRKALVMPAEHGSWSWLLVPFLVGIGVAGRHHWQRTLLHLT